MVDRAFHGPQVIASAFPGDLFRPCRRVALRVEKHFREPLLAIADRHAIDFEHVAKRLQLVADRFVDQEVRSQFAMLRRDGRRRAHRRQCTATAAYHARNGHDREARAGVLQVPLFGHHTGELQG